METLLLDRAPNGVVTLTLNRPRKLNALTGVMFDELLAVFREVATSPTDRVLVITGAGNAFCSGADLSAGPPVQGPPMTAMRRVAEVMLAQHHLPQPIIAKVNGVAAGGGCNLALGCDLIVAADTARFSEIFVRRGLSVDMGGTWLLPRLVGMHRAKELSFFGDVISAKEAAEIGLVNRVVPAAELDSFVRGWADRLAAGPPIALGLTKRLLTNAFSVTLDEALEHEGMAQTVNITTEDTGEAIAAFLEKREPRFQGR